MRRWLVRFVIGLVALALLDTALWYAAEMQMRASWRNTLAQATADGWHVTSGEAHAEGWPTAARLRVDGLEMSRDDGRILAGGIGFGAQYLLLDLPFRLPLRLAIRPQGSQHLRAGVLPDSSLNAGDLVLRTALDGGFANLVAENLVWSTPPAPLALGHLSAELHQNRGAHPAQGSLVATLDGLDISLLAQRFGLQGLIAHAGLDVGLQDGIVTLRDFAINWGKLAVNGSATMHADAAGQPAGEGKIVIVGADETLADLAAAGRITPQNAATGTMILRMLQRPGPDGRNVVELPLGLRDRALTVAQFPLARLPAMNLSPGIIP